MNKIDSPRCANSRGTRRPTRSFVLIIAIVTCALSTVTTTFAQGPVTVSGVVTDASGGVVEGASVEAVLNDRAIATARTGSDGRYGLQLLPSREYQLRVRRDGFAEHVSIVRTDASGATRDIKLDIGAVGDNVVVTASRVAESRAKTTESITVLTAADIAAMGAPSLAEVVRMTPGVNVESTGREGSVASLFSRGGESDYNHVLIDGVRVNISGGQYDFSRVTGAEIERVEIVRGAQSALYGSDAIGSVVQVFTKRAGAGDAPRVNGAIEGGSFSTWRGDLSLLGGARGHFDYNVGITHRRTDGAFADLLPEPDRFDQTSFNGGFGTVIGDRATLRSSVRLNDAEGRAVGQIAYGARDRGTTYDSDDVSWHLDFTQRLTSRLNHSATVAYFRFNSLSADTVADPTYNVYAILEGQAGALYPDSPRLVRLIDLDTFNAIRAGSPSLGANQLLASTSFGVSDFPFSSRTEFRRPAFKYQADYRWLDNQLLIGGYEYERETNPLSDGFKAENHAYFVQQQFAARDRWFVGIGGRLNDNSRFGTEFSPKLSIGGYLVPYTTAALSSVKVFANIGKGIKNPTFGELFGGVVDGNPDLHPERARTIDVGAELTFARQRWLTRATYFDNNFKDQVAFRSTGRNLDGLPDYLNIDGSKAKGLELEASLQRPLAGFIATAAYWHTDTEVVSFVSTSEQFQPGQPLIRRPQHAALMRVTYVRGPASVNLNMRYTGQRHDAAFLGLSTVPSPQFPTGRSVDITVNPGYTRWWIGGDWRLYQDATVFVRIDNLTNTSYESALGYPGLPRAFVVGARFAVTGR